MYNAATAIFELELPRGKDCLLTGTDFIWSTLARIFSLVEASTVELRIVAKARKRGDENEGTCTTLLKVFSGFSGCAYSLRAWSTRGNTASKAARSREKAAKIAVDTKIWAGSSVG